MNKVLSVFNNRTHALNFSRALGKQGVKTKVVNTPREISSSCGLSVVFEIKDIVKAKYGLKIINATSFVGFYALKQSNNHLFYTKISL